MPPSRPHVSPQASSRYPLIAAAILLLAFGLRVWNLGDASLWADEAWSAKWANSSLIAFYQEIILRRSEIQLPLHMSSLHLIATNQEMLLRFPSVIVSLVGIAAFMLLVRRIYANWSLSLWAGLILATNPLHVWLSRGARPYSYFFTSLIFISFFFLLLISGRRSQRVWAGFVISSFLAYLTHYFALLLPVVQYLLLGLYLKRFSRLLRPWLLAQIAAGSGLLTLWIIQIIADKPTIAGIAWIPEPRLFDIPLSLANMLIGYTGGVSWLLFLGLPSALLGFVLGAARIARRRDPVNLYWLLLTTVPIVAIFIVSKVLHPIYVDRYLSEIQAGAIIIMLLGWWQLPRHSWRYALAILVVVSGLLTFWQTIYSGDYEREDWRGAAHYVADQMRPTDIVVLDAEYYELAFMHYFEPSTVPLYTVNELAEFAGSGAERGWVMYRNPNEDVHRQGVMPDFDPFDPTLSPTGEWLASQRDQVLARADFNGITVLLLNMERGQ